MAIKKGYGYSPLTDKVYIGKQDDVKRIWIGKKEDATNDFLNILHQYIPHNSSRTITVSGNTTNLIINVDANSVSIDKAIETLNKFKDVVKQFEEAK